MQHASRTVPLQVSCSGAVDSDRCSQSSANRVSLTSFLRLPCSAHTARSRPASKQQQTLRRQQKQTQQFCSSSKQRSLRHSSTVCVAATAELATKKTTVKIGTRGSPLALAQAYMTRDFLKVKHYSTHSNASMAIHCCLLTTASIGEAVAASAPPASDQQFSLHCVLGTEFATRGGFSTDATLIWYQHHAWYRTHPNTSAALKYVSISNIQP